jgi:curved DNA-binding protein CbpA
LKNYYFILGLNIYASESQIKQAYRRLALQFHPDKNPSAEAETIFKEINEAYETLGDSEKKTTYDLLLKGISPVVYSAPSDSPPHRDPRYKPRPPGSFSRKSKRQELLDVMSDYLKYAIIISRLSLAFAILLVLDFSMPKEKTERQVLYTSYRKEIRGGRSIQLNLKDGVAISLSKKDAQEFRQGEKIFIYRSSLFGVPTAVENEKTHFIAKIPVAIYGNFIFFPMILLITSILGVFYWKGVEFRFNLGVVNFFLTLLSVILLRIHFF